MKRENTNFSVALPKLSYVTFSRKQWPWRVLYWYEYIVGEVGEGLHVLFAKLLAVGFGTRPDFKEDTGGGDQSESTGSGVRTRLLEDTMEADDFRMDGPGEAFR